MMTPAPVTDYPLTAGDSVVVTITQTLDSTGAEVTPDAGSVSATLSNLSDSVIVDPSGTFLTITAGTTPVVGATVTVNATFNGVPADAPAVGTYDVVAVVEDNATSLALTFGTETAPAAEGDVSSFVGAAAAENGASAAAIAADPAKAADPDFRFNEATGTFDHV